MSIALMTAVWRLDLPPSDKMVLLALADAANDDGITWMALQSKEGVKLDLLKKTSLSRRAVQGALKRLCEAGYLSRSDRPGKGVIWTVKGCTSCAPQQMHPAADAPRGAAGAPKPSTNPLTPPEANASEDDAPRKRKAGSRFVPEDFSPSPDHHAKAQAMGLTAGDLERALNRFRNHEFPRTYTDWNRTFTNWLDRETPSDDRPTNDHRRASYAQPSRAERDQSAALEVLARRGALPRQDFGGDIHELRPAGAQGPGGGGVALLPTGRAA